MISSNRSRGASGPKAVTSTWFRFSPRRTSAAAAPSSSTAPLAPAGLPFAQRPRQHDEPRQHPFRQRIVDVLHPHAARFLPVGRHSRGLELVQRPRDQPFFRRLAGLLLVEWKTHIKAFHQPQEEPCGVLHLPGKRGPGLGQGERAVAARTVLETQQAVDAVGNPVGIEHRRVPQARLVDEVQHRAQLVQQARQRLLLRPVRLALPRADLAKLVQLTQLAVKV